MTMKWPRQNASSRSPLEPTSLLVATTSAPTTIVTTPSAPTHRRTRACVMPTAVATTAKAAKAVRSDGAPSGREANARQMTTGIEVATEATMNARTFPSASDATRARRVRTVRMARAQGRSLWTQQCRGMRAPVRLPTGAASRRAKVRGSARAISAPLLRRLSRGGGSFRRRSARRRTPASTEIAPSTRRSASSGRPARNTSQPAYALAPRCSGRASLPRRTASPRRPPHQHPGVHGHSSAACRRRLVDGRPRRPARESRRPRRSLPIDRCHSLLSLAADR